MLIQTLVVLQNGSRSSEAGGQPTSIKDFTGFAQLHSKSHSTTLQGLPVYTQFTLKRSFASVGEHVSVFKGKCEKMLKLVSAHLSIFHYFDSETWSSSRRAFSQEFVLLRIFTHMGEKRCKYEACDAVFGEKETKETHANCISTLVNGHVRSVCDIVFSDNDNRENYIFYNVIPEPFSLFDLPKMFSQT